MAEYWCLIIPQLNPKARVDVKNGQLKAIKAVLRLSRRPIHALIFKVRFYFQSFTTTKPIIKEAPIYLGHCCSAIRFICPFLVNLVLEDIRNFLPNIDLFI